MSQVDFYVLAGNSSKENFACALIQKVWKQGENIFINMSSMSMATAFDDLLWTFKDISFLPHALLAEDDVENVSIVIGYSQQMGDYLADHAAIVLNFAEQVPIALNKAVRVLEIVAGSEVERQQARKRYADYRQLGHVLNKHTIDHSYG